MENDTVWLTQKQIAELFGTKRPAITKHLKNIFVSEELNEASTCSKLEHMDNEGKQLYSTENRNISIGNNIVTDEDINQLFHHGFLSVYSQTYFFSFYKQA